MLVQSINLDNLKDGQWVKHPLPEPVMLEADKLYGIVLDNGVPSIHEVKDGIITLPDGSRLGSNPIFWDKEESP